MRRLPEGRQGRILALALLVASLALIYLVFVHWWFAAPLMQARAELIELRDDESRFRHTALQRPAIEQRLAEVRAFEASNPGFLPEDNFDLAASALIQRLRGQVEALGGGQCTLVSTTPVRSREEEPFTRVVVRVQMRCETESLLQVLHGLESGSPQLFVNEFGATRRTVRGSFPSGGQGNSGLEVAFELYGYLRQRGSSQ